MEKSAKLDPSYEKTGQNQKLGVQLALKKKSNSLSKFKERRDFFEGLEGNKVVVKHPLMIICSSNRILLFFLSLFCFGLCVEHGKS